MLMMLFSVIAYGQADWTTDLDGVVSGVPGELAGFDAFGDPITYDIDDTVTGVVIPFGYLDEVAVDAEIAEIIPGLIDTAVIDVLAECETLVDDLAATVAATCDAEIDALVPDMITDAIVDLESTLSAPVFDFGANSRYAWLQIAGASTSVSGVTAGFLWANPHVEETGRAYASVSLVTAGSPSLHDVTFAIYEIDESTHQPGAVVWTTGVQSASPVGEKVFPFSSGTFTTYGAAYDDGSGNLLLARGSAVAIVQGAGGTVTMRAFPVSSVRQLGVDVTGGTAFSGWQAAHVFGDPMPDPFPTPTPRTTTVGAYLLDPL